MFFLVHFTSKLSYCDPINIAISNLLLIFSVNCLFLWASVIMAEEQAEKNPLNVEDQANPENPPARLTKSMEQNRKDEIRRGFASPKYYKRAPRSKKFSVGFWNIRQIFDRNGDKLLTNYFLAAIVCCVRWKGLW